MAYEIYNPHEWDSSDYFTPSKMNHIEEGIESTNLYARSLYRPEVLINVNIEPNYTYADALNDLYAALDNLNNQVIADGYLQIGSNIFRLDRKTTSLYGFSSVYVSNDHSMNTLALQVKSSGSVYQRLYITTAGVISSTDISGDPITDTVIFYGRS